jgi:hypothetical protein
MLPHSRDANARPVAPCDTNSTLEDMKYFVRNRSVFVEATRACTGRNSRVYAAPALPSIRCKACVRAMLASLVVLTDFKRTSTRKLHRMGLLLLVLELKLELLLLVLAMISVLPKTAQQGTGDTSSTSRHGLHHISYMQYTTHQPFSPSTQSLFVCCLQPAGQCDHSASCRRLPHLNNKHQVCMFSGLSDIICCCVGIYCSDSPCCSTW